MKRLISSLLLIVALFASSQAQAIERQRAMNWCWAASIQDVMAQVGRNQSQEQIAARLDGWPRDRPAYIGELVVLLKSYGFRAWQAGRPGSPQELFNTLSTGWKLIAFVHPSGGAVGHYIVLQGIDPSTGGVIVSDPWTGATYQNSLPQLYAGWRWSDSVVVGAPIQ